MTRNFSILFLIIMLILIHNKLLAQEETIVLDTLSKVLTKNFPFDKSFTLKIGALSKEKLSAVSLFKLSRNGCLENVYDKDCLRKILGIKDIKDSVNKLLITQRQKKRVIASITKSMDSAIISFEIKNFKQYPNGEAFINMPALEPNTRYFIALSYRVRLQDDERDSILKAIHSGVHEQQVYEEISSKYQKAADTVKCSGCRTVTFRFNPYERFHEYYVTNKINLLYDSLLKLKGQEMSLKKTVPKLTKSECSLPIDKKLVSSFIRYSEECVHCNDSTQQYQWFLKNSIKIPLILTSLEHLTDSAILEGETKIDSVGFQISTSNTPISIRIANLSHNISAVASTLNLLQYYDAKYNVNNNNLTTLLNSLQCILVNLKNNYSLLKSYQNKFLDITKAQVDISSKIDHAFENFEGFMSPFQLLNSDSYTASFETRSGFVIKPDFGFMAYGNPWNSSLSGFLPYLGFHVNFRPLNTDVPYQLISNKRFLGHLSFNSGVVIGSIKEELKRDGLINDVSIFTGLGYAFGHAVRINTGALWYRKLNPNPLINGKTTSATPYLGVSLDLRLRDIYTTFTRLF